MARPDHRGGQGGLPRLNRAVEEYHRLLAADPQAALDEAARQREAFASAGITFAGQPMDSFLRPHFVARAQWDSLRAAGSRLVELCARVAREAFAADTGRLCAYLRLTQAEARWAQLDLGLPHVLLSRLDGFCTSDAARFIELNSGAPAGFGYGDQMARVFAGMEVFRRFSERHASRYVPSAPGLVGALLALWRGRSGSRKPRVAIVDFAEVKTRADQELLRGEFLAAGVECVLVDPRELELRQDRLWAGSAGLAIDVVYRRAVLAELLAVESEVQAFFEAYRRGLAVFANGFRCRLSEDKAVLALLWDEDHARHLSSAEQAFVARHVPWTSRLQEGYARRRGRRIDLIPHVFQQREGLVLKPGHGYGGRSVFVGAELEPRVWQEVVEARLGGAWVVQERIEPPEEDFPVFSGDTLCFEPLKVATNPFYVAGAEVGAVTRLSRDNVINVSAGGGAVPTFVLD